MSAIFNRYFYHELLRRYTIVFGSMFNNIYVQRVDANGKLLQNVRVPLTYAPKQKFIAWLDEMSLVNPSTSTKPRKALTLPRIAFEMGAVRYDGSRRLPRLSKYVVVDPDDKNQRYIYVPAPYVINFRMAVLVKNAEDGTKIIEQILPFFSPDYTVTMNLIPEMGDRGKFDTTVVLNSTQVNDTYSQGNIDDRRAIIWDLEFEMKALFFGPTHDGAKPIKSIDINLRVPDPDTVIADATPENTPKVATLNTRPGLTADGEPTTDINETIPFAEIQEDDPWDFIEQLTEYL